MNAKLDVVRKTFDDLEKEQCERNFRRLLQRQCPPIETLNITPGTARWAFEHARRGLPVPKVLPPISGEMLDIRTQDAV